MDEEKIKKAIVSLMLSDNLGDVHDAINMLHDAINLPHPEGNFLEGFADEAYDALGFDSRG